MSNKQFECLRCYKRYGNAGALKTHEKPEPKSESMLKWVVKHVKSEIKPSAKMGIELNPIVKTRQLKLRKPLVREPIVDTNPVHPLAPRRPRRSKQPFYSSCMADTSLFSKAITAISNRLLSALQSVEIKICVWQEGVV